MRICDVQVLIQSRKQAFRKAAEVFEKLRKGKQLTPSRTLGFPDVDTFRKFLTEKRLELLQVVRKRHPNSLYELAKLLNRDLKSVNTDVSLLKHLGLIRLEKQRHGRTRVIPRVLFDRMQVNIAIA